jgi:hypothetical protein
MSLLDDMIAAGRELFRTRFNVLDEATRDGNPHCGYEEKFPISTGSDLDIGSYIGVK